MAKSNMRSVRMRKQNRQLHTQDRLRQKAERHSVQQRTIRRNPIRRNSVQGFIRRFFSGIKNWFKPRSFPSIRNLDLRTTFDRDRRAGATQLRNMFSSLNMRMVSTRDGRRV